MDTSKLIALIAAFVICAEAENAVAQNTASLRAVLNEDASAHGAARIRSSFRSTARSNARGTTPFDVSAPGKLEAVLPRGPLRPAAKELLPPRYMAHFSGGKQRLIADYRDDGDSFWIQWIEGGHARYLKSMVDHFASLSEAESDTLMADMNMPAGKEAQRASAPKPELPATGSKAPESKTSQPRRYELGPLQPGDFAAEPPTNRGGRLAYTYSAIEYYYRYRTRILPSGVQLIATEIETHATVDPGRSWNLTPENTRLMDHEQGHFDITRLHATHWQRHASGLISRTALVGEGVSSQAAAQALNARVASEFAVLRDIWEAEQIRYDNETNHGAQRNRQDQWRQKLNAELQTKRAAGN